MVRWARPTNARGSLRYALVRCLDHEGRTCPVGLPSRFEHAIALARRAMQVPVVVPLVYWHQLSGNRSRFALHHPGDSQACCSTERSDDAPYPGLTWHLPVRTRGNRRIDAIPAASSRATHLTFLVITTCIGLNPHGCFHHPDRQQPLQDVHHGDHLLRRLVPGDGAGVSAEGIDVSSVES